MGFLELPSELIAQIFVYLDDDDVFAARSTAKALDKASLAHFGKRFFRKKGFMITSLSLGVLQHISDHPELRKYVQHVWFNPDCYTFARPACAPDDEDDDLDEADGIMTPLEKRHSEATARMNALLSKRYDAYQECMRDHNCLMYTLQLQEKLSAALAPLSNLQTIGMRRSEDYSPYGWTILREAIGEDPRVLGTFPSKPGHRLSGPTQLFIAVLHALSKSNIRLRRFYTDAVEIDNIKEKALPQSLLNDACHNIWYIELNATKAWLVKSKRTEGGEEQNATSLKDPTMYGASLVRLFSAMPQLKEIGLQIFPDRGQSQMLPPSLQNLDSWRQSYPYASLLRLVNEVAFPNLTRIKLERVTSTSTILCKFLSPCAQNLTSLKLRDIRLLSSEDDPRPWRTVFAYLNTHCSSLAYILLYYLKYDRGGISFVQDPAPAHSGAQDSSFISPVFLGTAAAQALFTTYEHISFEAKGIREVRSRVEEIIERHWYHKPLFSYAMDEELWHTDTSDDEW